MYPEKESVSRVSDRPSSYLLVILQTYVTNLPSMQHFLVAEDLFEIIHVYILSLELRQ